MKPKIIQVRGVAIEKSFDSVNDELLGILDRICKGDWKVAEEMNFVESYKSNRRGSHFDIFLGEVGTIIFRPFNYIDGLDDWCSFDLKRYSEGDKHAMEFYQWSSKRHSKMDLWLNSEHLVTASQKKALRAKGNKTLIKNKDVYETTNFFIKYIVGLNVEELTDQHKVYRCKG